MLYDSSFRCSHFSLIKKSFEFQLTSHLNIFLLGLNFACGQTTDLWIRVCMLLFGLCGKYYRCFNFSTSMNILSFDSVIEEFAIFDHNKFIIIWWMVHFINEISLEMLDWKEHLLVFWTIKKIQLVQKYTNYVNLLIWWMI